MDNSLIRLTQKPHGKLAYTMDLDEFIDEEDDFEMSNGSSEDEEDETDFFKQVTGKAPIDTQMATQGLNPEIMICRQKHICDFKGFEKEFKTLFLEDPKKANFTVNDMNVLFNCPTLFRHLELCSSVVAEIKLYEFTALVVTKDTEFKLLPHVLSK